MLVGSSNPKQNGATIRNYRVRVALGLNTLRRQPSNRLIEVAHELLFEPLIGPRHTVRVASPSATLTNVTASSTRLHIPLRLSLASVGDSRPSRYQQGAKEEERLFLPP